MSQERTKLHPVPLCLATASVHQYAVTGGLGKELTGSRGSASSVFLSVNNHIKVCKLLWGWRESPENKATLALGCVQNILIYTCAVHLRLARATPGPALRFDSRDSKLRLKTEAFHAGAVPLSLGMG